ncbi:unnamed protein product [Discosporangium mesarthrocarpum]
MRTASGSEKLQPSPVEGKVGKMEQKAQRSGPDDPNSRLIQILDERGYPTEPLSPVSPLYVTVPTEEMTKDYDRDFISVVRSGDLESLRAFRERGRNMNACNKFGESLLHLAMRMGNLETVQFMVESGAWLLVCDDYGRTPLHDACWCPQAPFDLVKIVLDQHNDSLLVKDRRGFTPLSYVQPERWETWCTFLETVKDKYWPRRVNIG